MTQLNETTNRAEMECSDVNPGAVQKGRTALSSPRRETRELSVIRNAISLREQLLRLQTTPKGGAHSNTSQLRWQTVPSLRARQRQQKIAMAKSSGKSFGRSLMAALRAPGMYLPNTYIAYVYSSQRRIV